MEKTDFEACVSKLKGSSMFYMSLGSKELFHSNFLHWLSIVEWSYFIKIMHALSGIEHFWWENLKEQEIEVRREDKNFDLSIWVFDSRKVVNRKNAGNEEESGENYCIDGEEQYKDRWIPVLILENKMKSLPYREQLENYVGKAYEFWRKGEGKSEIKNEIVELKKDYSSTWQNNFCQKWNTKHGITFILLSLLEPTNKEELEKGISKVLPYSREKKNINLEITFKWICKTYNDLIESFPIEEINPQKGAIDKGFANQIVEDYKQFVKALYTISKIDWELNQEMAKTLLFLDKVCPKFSNNTDERNKIDELANLRVSDVREKICYDQLLKLLLEKLDDSEIRRLNKSDLNDNKLRNEFLCRTNYFHNVGLFEVIYMIKERDKEDEEPFFLTIQIQGNYYTHGISGKNIVADDKNGKNIVGTFFDDKGGKGYWEEKLKFFFDFNRENKEIAHLPIKDDGAFYKYGSNFIYQCAVIPNDLSIMDVIDKIVEEVKIIKEHETDLKFPIVMTKPK